MQIHNITLPKAGDANVLLWTEKELDATLSSQEVLVEVHYSGINFADLHMRQGLYPDAPKFPFVPGYEVSGIIKAVGSEVNPKMIGQKVMVGTYFGGYSSHIKVSQWQVFAIPEFLNLQEAAATPVSFLTAYFTLFEMARVRHADKILVDCASGALGSMMAQLLGDSVVELVGLTSSESKMPHLKDIGYRAMTHDQLLDSKESFDVIINSRGGQSIRQHFNKLNPCGRMICLGASDAVARGARNWIKALKTFLQMPRFSAIELMNANKVVGGVNLLNLFNDQKLVTNRMLQMKNFKFKPLVDRVFPAQKVGDAHAYIENKYSKGKVLLEWKN